MSFTPTKQKLPQSTARGLPSPGAHSLRNPDPSILGLQYQHGQPTRTRRQAVVKNVHHIMGEVVIKHDLYYLLIGDDMPDYRLVHALRFNAPVALKEYLERTRGGLQFDDVNDGGPVSVEEHEQYGTPLPYQQYVKTTKMIVHQCELHSILANVSLKGVKALYLVLDTQSRKVIVTEDFLMQNYKQAWCEYHCDKRSFNFMNGTGKNV